VPGFRLIGLAVCLCAAATSLVAAAQPIRKVVLRGHELTLRLYGDPQGDPVIVSSGDGGWIHLGPHVAEVLAAHGFYAIGFDVKTYLSSFTSGSTVLRPRDEPADFKVLADFAYAATGKKPILVGVSEGAGLSVLAATDPATKAAILGIVGLGMPDVNELGWRWKDDLTYLTHKVPNEPTFSAAAIVAGISPLPLAAIHSTHDEFVPLADVQHLLDRASEPTRLWIVSGADHRFSNNLEEFDRRLLEAMAWVRSRAPR
jgi:alpha-beta hydrolase superfamily lysophospholipase